MDRAEDLAGRCPAAAARLESTEKERQLISERRGLPIIESLQPQASVTFEASHRRLTTAAIAQRAAAQWYVSNVKNFVDLLMPPARV